MNAQETAIEQRKRIYVRYKQTLWKLWNSRFTLAIASEYPDTGGVEHYLHNWYCCSANKDVAAAALELRDSYWARWHKISARGDREYKRAEHGTHSEKFRPIWCEYCKQS